MIYSQVMTTASPNTGGNAPFTTVAPIAAPGQPASLEDTLAKIGAQMRPEFLRLPKPGTLCPMTGLGRSYMNSLILPTAANGHRPPVASVCLRQRGAKKGVRLVVYDSLISYLRAHLESANDEAEVGK